MVYSVESMDDFNSQLAAAGDKLVVVDFHATWCGPCKMIAPHLEEMSHTMKDVVFLKVDVDECEDIAAKYKVSAMPTFIFIKSKKKVADMTGANIEKLKKLVATNTNNTFQGSGNVLGSIAPSVAPPSASPSLDPVQAEKAAQQACKLSDTGPVANIQVRLADGSRLIVKLNHTHTVADLRLYIHTARPQYAGVQYTLLTTFPNKELTDNTQTMASAGLVGAAVLQRIK
eukprot:GFUD01021488.1.p1 GENE.GFUD01021488.1~~GFUD01021488.1.p1  ORF type:complete len:229 (-),score=87.61 GFUD01021488.1:208-894(-)